MIPLQMRLNDVVNLQIAHIEGTYSEMGTTMLQTTSTTSVTTMDTERKMDEELDN